MTLDILYLLVTEAIQRADTLAELGAPSAAQAQLDVSLLEEQIAASVPASDPEGALARRGAVRAAGAAKHYTRAQELASRFLSEEDASTELRAQIGALLADQEDSIATRCPRIAARIGVAEVRRVACAFARQGAPFPIC